MSNRTTNWRFTATGTQKFANDVATAGKAINAVNQQLRMLDATYGKGSKNSDYLSKRTELLTQKLEAQRQRTEALRQGLEKYRASGAASAAEIERREKQVKNAEIAEADLTRQIRECSMALQDQQVKAERSSVSVEKLAAGASKAGNALTKALTIPIAGMGVMALKSALELEDAMKTVQTLPGVTSGSVQQQAAQMEVYTDGILAASDATHIVAEELAAAQYSAISAGVAAEDSVRTVERSAKAAKAGLTDVETVVNGATSVLNAWGESAGGLNHVLDAMIVAQNEGKTNVGELASQIGQITGLAPQLNVAFDEVMATVAALTKAGVSTSSSINGLKAVLAGVMKPTAEAREEAERLGLQFDAVALQTQGLTSFLSDVMLKTGGSAESLALLFGSVEALSEIMALGTTASEDYASALSKIQDADGAVDNAFAVRVSSRAEQLAGAMNRLRNSGIDIAEALYPAVDAAADLFRSLADFVGDMDEDTQRALVNLLGIAAATGPVLKAVGGLGKAGSGAVGFVMGLTGHTTALNAAGKELLPTATKAAAVGSSLAKVIGGSGGLLAGLKSVALTLAGPVGVAAGLALLGVGAYQLHRHLSDAADSSSTLSEILSHTNYSLDEASAAQLTSEINAAVDKAKAEHTVTLNTKVLPDTEEFHAEIDEIAQELNETVAGAFVDLKINWEEYRRITSMLNQDMLPQLQEALESEDPVVAAAAAQAIALVDSQNQLLNSIFVAGGEMTEAQRQQFETNMEQINAYRAQVENIAIGVANQYAVLTQMVNTAAEDARVSQAEYDAIHAHLTQNVIPEAQVAMEEAATAVVGSRLAEATADLDALLSSIQSSGEGASAEQLARMQALLAEIEVLRSQISVIRQDTGSVYAEMTRSVNAALADYQVSLEEFEAVQAQLNQVRPDVEAAMEDAATDAVAGQLDSALDELEALMASIQQAGRDATQEEIDQMNALLAQIAQLQADIAVLQGRTDLLTDWEGELENDDAYLATATGQGDRHTFVEAVAQAKALYEQRLEAFSEEERRHAATRDETMNSPLAEESEKTVAQEVYGEQMAAVRAARSAAEADYIRQMQELFLGAIRSSETASDTMEKLERLERERTRIIENDTSSWSSAEWAKALEGTSLLDGIDARKRDREYVQYVLDGAMNGTVQPGSAAYDDYGVIADAQARYQDWQKEEWLRKVAALDWNRTNLDDYFGASFAGTPIADNYQALSRSGYMDSISPELALYLRYHDLLTTPRDDEGIAAWVWTSSFNPSTRKTTGAPWGIQGSEDWHQNLLTDGGSSTEQQAPDESEEEAQEAAKGAAEALLKAAMNGFQEGFGFGRPMEDSFAAKIREMLAGLVPMTPGMQQPGNMSAGTQQLAPMMTGDINSSVSVVIQTANIRSEQDIYTLADKINAAARANLAGIGLPVKG